MKWMIASDLHGSAYYCKALLERLAQEGADRLLLLGDILYHGPRNDLPKEYNPKAVIPMLNDIKEKILCVRGNCDSEVDQMVLQFPILADYCYIVDGKAKIFATHGHLFHQEHLPTLQRGEILLHGHTHVPGYVEHTDYLYLNPGSVSIPKGDSVRQYLTLEQDVFTWKDLETGEILLQYTL